MLVLYWFVSCWSISWLIWGIRAKCSSGHLQGDDLSPNFPAWSFHHDTDTELVVVWSVEMACVQMPVCSKMVGNTPGSTPAGLVGSSRALSLAC